MPPRRCATAGGMAGSARPPGESPTSSQAGDFSPERPVARPRRMSASGAAQAAGVCGGTRWGGAGTGAGRRAGGGQDWVRAETTSGSRRARAGTLSPKSEGGVALGLLAEFGFM